MAVYRGEADIGERHFTEVPLGGSAFKFVICGGKLAVLWSEISFYGDADVNRQFYGRKFHFTAMLM